MQRRKTEDGRRFQLSCSRGPRLDVATGRARTILEGGREEGNREGGARDGWEEAGGRSRGREVGFYEGEAVEFASPAAAVGGGWLHARASSQQAGQKQTDTPGRPPSSTPPPTILRSMSSRITSLLLKGKAPMRPLLAPWASAFSPAAAARFTSTATSPPRPPPSDTPPSAASPSSSAPPVFATHQGVYTDYHVQPDKSSPLKFHHPPRLNRTPSPKNLPKIPVRRAMPFRRAIAC